MNNCIFNYIIWTLVAALYSPILFQLYRSRWEMIDYTHAYFILPVSLWLAWRKRSELGRLIGGSSYSLTAGLVILIFGLLMFIFGWRQEYLFISTLSSIPVLFGLTICMYGAGAAKGLSFPILYLLLMVPPPLGVLDSITLPMRYGVSVITAEILKIFGYPITREGLVLSLGGHEIFMGAPCSGFRSLITMISLGLAYVYITRSSLFMKGVLLASIVPLALLGNLVRVLSVCLTTFYFGEKIGHIVHEAGGFIIFVVLILGMLGLETALSKFVRRP